MGKWMDLAAQLEAASDTRDKRDSRDVSAPQYSTGPALPATIKRGLRRLESMAAPRLMHPERWPTVVADCLRLGREGWAAKALALGWAPLELFGAVTDKDDDPFGDGLAIWLGGRTVLAVSETCAIAADRHGRSYYNRRHADVATLIWDIGQ